MSSIESILDLVRRDSLASYVLIYIHICIRMTYMCIFDLSVYLPMFMYKYVYMHICCPMQQRVVVCVVHTHIILTSSAAKGTIIDLDVRTLLHPRTMSHGGIFFKYLLVPDYE